jgi:hypothetical protein
MDIFPKILQNAMMGRSDAITLLHNWQAEGE